VPRRPAAVIEGTWHVHKQWTRWARTATTRPSRPLGREAAQQARFGERIDAGDFIEARTDARDTARRCPQISQHAHSEIVGMLPEGNWISRA
jgi:hypothetical protein